MRVGQHRRTHRRVAVKCIRKRALKGKEAMLENEITVLRRLEESNIIRLVIHNTVIGNPQMP